MKTTLIILCSFMMLNTGFAQDGILIWNDEFETNGAPDPAKWGYDLGTNNGWGNNELENYTNSPANVHIADGLLYINAIKTNGNWTSARVKTQNKFNFTYGKIKFRAKLPTGTGTWPALWMLAETITTKGWPACGEIDVMEHVGKNPGVVQSALHTTSSSGNTVNTGAKTVSTFSTEFHIYEADWTPEQIRFSVDGVPFYTYRPSPKTTANWPFNTPFFVIMNLAIGGNFGGTVDPALTAAEFQIDYVRVYQSFELFPLTGPTVVAKNQTGLTYSIKQLVGATYSWSVPDDAQIVTGTGTNQIVVNWGETDGEVTVHVTLDGENYEKSVLVTQSVKPQGSAFPLQSEEFNMLWTNNPANVNLYPFESQRPLRVDYTVAQKNSSPALFGTFPRAMDLSEHPVLRVKAKTFNKSKTVSMRMDFVDANGVATTKSPVFDFLPLIDDGEYYKYSFNFKTRNLWSSTTGPVDSKRISKINFYIDYGVSAVTGYDSIWVDSLWVEQEPGDIYIPNRPSHLSGTKGGNIELHWLDRSDNETGFEIFESANLTGPYTSSATTGANETSAIIALTASAEYYQVKSFNAAGYSDASNKVSKIEMLVTAINDRGLEHITLYPNPTTGNLLVESPSGIGTIKLVDMLGREIFLREVSSHQSKLDLSQFAKGTYYLHILGKNRNDVKKVILQ